MEKDARHKRKERWGKEKEKAKGKAWEEEESGMENIAVTSIYQKRTLETIYDLEM